MALLHQSRNADFIQRQRSIVLFNERSVSHGRMIRWRDAIGRTQSYKIALRVGNQGRTLFLFLFTAVQESLLFALLLHWGCSGWVYLGTEVWCTNMFVYGVCHRPITSFNATELSADYLPAFIWLRTISNASRHTDCYNSQTPLS